jgi:hypothetical protein
MCHKLLMLWTLCSHRVLVAQVDDLDRETFDSVLMSTFLSDIIIDRPSTSGSRDTDASGSGGGPS